MRMDEKECYLDKLFFLGIYVGIFATYFKWSGSAKKEVIHPLQIVGEIYFVTCYTQM